MDENGVPWNFDLAERRQAAREKFRAEKPMFLVGSPMCTHFCSWQALNDVRREPEEVRRERVRAMVRMELMCEMYREQADAGRCFLHEHPAGATSWNEECVEQVMELEGSDVVIGDQCQYGQEANDGTPIKKPTKWMSNSPEVLKKLGARCSGRGGACSRPSGGVHTTAEGSVTRGTAVYTFQLCKVILQGFRNQLVADGRLVLGAVGVQRPEETLEDWELERMCARSLNILVELNEAHGEEEFKDASGSVRTWCARRDARSSSTSP